VISAAERVFIDTGAFVALAERRDPEHERARAAWESLTRSRARLPTSVLVVAETFTFIDRRGSREAALRRRESLRTGPTIDVLDCTAAHLERAWSWLHRKELHKLGIVDACSFVLMQERKIRVAFAFDSHFAIAGFRYAHE
jgi:predicted nucleic acid-binding protein